MASPRPNRPGAALGHGPSDGYDEEARKGQIIPTGSRSQPGTPIGIGLGLRELLRIPLPRTSVNKGKKEGPRRYVLRPSQHLHYAQTPRRWNAATYAAVSSKNRPLAILPSLSV